MKDRTYLIIILGIIFFVILLSIILPFMFPQKLEGQINSSNLGLNPNIPNEKTIYGFYTTMRNISEIEVICKCSSPNQNQSMFKFCLSPSLWKEWKNDKFVGDYLVYNC